MSVSFVCTVSDVARSFRDRYFSRKICAFFVDYLSCPKCFGLTFGAFIGVLLYKGSSNPLLFPLGFGVSVSFFSYIASRVVLHLEDITEK
jgi:hypothetical protein